MNNNDNISAQIRKGSMFAMLFLLCTIAVVFFVSKNNIHFITSNVEDYTNGWNITFSDKNGDHVLKGDPSEIIKTTSIDESGVTISRRIDDIDISKHLFINCLHQNIKVYVDSNLVYQCGNINELKFGNTYPQAYYEIEIKPEYTGKKMIIKYQADNIRHRSEIGKIYLATKADFIGYLMYNYKFDIVFGILFVLLGVFWVITEVVLKKVYLKNVNLDCIGMFAIMYGIFVLTGCEGRQVYIANIFFAEKVHYMMLSSMCIPLILLVNSRQEYKYTKWMIAVSLIHAVNTFVCFLLDVVGIIGICHSGDISHILIILTFVFALVLMILDYRNGLMFKIKDITISFSILMLAALIKIIAEYRFGENIPAFKAILYLGVITMLTVQSRGVFLALMKLEDSKRGAEQASKAKSNFLANMSHEIRTPINAILGMDEMILRETCDENIKPYAKNIKNAGSLLLSIINDILDFSKIESGKMELVEGEYEIVSMLNDVIIMMRKRAKDKGLEFKVNISPNLPVKMYGDDVRIRQVITNIISNAVKYTREGSVTFNVGYSNGKDKDENGNKTGILLVSVEDTGIGIREEDIEKLFDSFQRLDEKANRNIEGTGLGMNITSHFLKLMKSELKVKSKYGKGSKFYFDLPQIVLDGTPIGDYDKAYIEYENSKKIDHSAFIAPDARILAVDDNEMNLEVLSGLLKETQIQVTPVNSGAKALDSLKDKEYDLILLDHMMPGMDGIETLKKLREQEDTQIANGQRKFHVPVVVLTANAISGAKEMYMEAGFQDYLVKPINSAELERVIKTYLPARLLQNRIVNKAKNSKNFDELTNNISVSKNLEDNNSETISNPYEKYFKEYGITIEDGIKFSGGKANKYKMMLNVFVKTDKTRREKLEAAFNSGDMAAYAIEAHALKSNARSIGANFLGDLAYEHEKAGKAGDATFVTGGYEKLIDSYSHILKGIAAIIEDKVLEAAPEPAKAQKNVGELSPKAVLELAGKENSNISYINNISDISILIEQYDRKAALKKLKKLAETVNQEDNTNLSTILASTTKFVEEFEFDKAIAELKKILN